nr:hypothetical protein [Providencia stuartii]
MQGTNWVKTAHELPQDGQYILAFSVDCEYVAGEYESDGSIYVSAGDGSVVIICVDFDFWQPLPLPPIPEGEWWQSGN